MITKLFKAFSKLILLFSIAIVCTNLFAPSIPEVRIICVDTGLCYKADKLAHDLTIYTNLYRRHGRQTYCNVWVTDIADSRSHDTWGNTYGFLINDYSIDISAIYPTAYSTMMMPINRAYDRAVKAIKRGELVQLTQEQAFYSAQQGRFVIVITKRYNHMAIVYPTLGDYDPTIGCTIAQAGYYNGIFVMSSDEAFGNNYQDKEILFVLCEEI